VTQNEEADPVGYKRPPREHQFRPGRSGNPSGRPKGARNFKSELREELSELITVRDGEREIQVSKQSRHCGSIPEAQKTRRGSRSKLMREKVKLLLRNDLLSFARKTFKEKNNGRLMPEDRYLELLTGRLADVVVGDTKRLIVNLPPRHFKSWIGSVCLSAWILGHDPAAKILIVTYGQELADKIAHTVREILRSEWYKELFGKTKLVKSRSKLVDFVTTAGGGVRSVSIEGGVTGHGADFIIITSSGDESSSDHAQWRQDRPRSQASGNHPDRSDSTALRCGVARELSCRMAALSLRGLR
jgi:Family of unknown function (DUF5681)